MALTQEATATLLMAAIKEDRAEIRAIKDRIHTNTSLIMTASFVMTTFLFDKTEAAGRWVWFALIDGALVMLMWVLFVKMIRDVNLGQRFMEQRERYLHELQELGADKKPPEVRLIFGPLVGHPKQGIKHRGYYWIVGCATLAILIKLAAIFALGGEWRRILLLLS